MRFLFAFILAATCFAAPAKANERFVPLGAATLAPFAHTHFCLHYPKECAQSQGGTGPMELTAARRQELVKVNAQVNRSICSKDQPHGEHGELEQWLLSPTTGDCNDYAVTKRHELAKLGWNPAALLLAHVVTTWGEHHLVLVVKTTEGDLVLDNLNANVRVWSNTQYRWVSIQSPKNPLYWQKVPRQMVSM